ncbi:hypothetical protein HARCEL1_04745 [Halococcoides cellulosivorans]|uniref:DUF3307 domain-containing protein n=1 Tax=Halococcoides cellulosivorans TaxID=1679096 RepID=A0A2R4WZT4_9EURY|nr:hypothetical protein HARCEL1_04745 [Halococcoides cellulosivorans]
MLDLFVRALYHLLSSGCVGWLVWRSTGSTRSHSSSTGPAGSINSISWSRLRRPLLWAVWTHIVVDIVEHRSPPKLHEGLVGFAGWLVDIVAHLA